ncbi:hypothetical protein R1sor_027423 [Riccia sorocarpa]|uniref:tetraacyldisaccharide 4'-kinase n=1 Tax=Riccia sorocarpa TaxID=122646 RepID=A0ABD3GE62_9MARC
MFRRIREGVVRIAKTSESDSNALPVLEKSLQPLLSTASVIYCGLSFVRRLLYRNGFLTQTRLPVPVVSVGNITWGGNGKTPMVETLSRWFLGAGICPLILTRGYAGGDEAQMLQMHLEGSCAKLGVGVNRVEIAHEILFKYGILSSQQRTEKAESLNVEYDDNSTKVWRSREGKIGVAIIDDGMQVVNALCFDQCRFFTAIELWVHTVQLSFNGHVMLQHLPLARDLEVVMVNVISLWGNQRTIPRGPLRESLGELRRADVVVLHHADLVSEERVQGIKDELSEHLRQDSIVICSSMSPQYLYRPPAPATEAGLQPRIQTHSRLPLDTLKNSVVLSVSGVGCPEALSLILERLGAHHVERMDYVDHHSFDMKDIQDVERRCVKLQAQFQGRAVLLVLTEKDYVREPFIWSKVSFVKVFILHACLRLISCTSSLVDFRKVLVKVASSSLIEGDIR